MSSQAKSVFMRNGRRAAEATGKLLRRAGSLAAETFSFLAADQTRRVVRKGSQRIEELLEAKRREFISHARSEAEVFVAEQIALIEVKVDEKIAEIELKVDRQIEKELRHKLRLLAWTLLAVVAVSLVSLAYLSIRRSLGL